MSAIRNIIFISVGILPLVGCVSPPSGPDVMALPGAGKSYEQFQMDDQVCRARAGGNSDLAVRQANDNAARSATVGTLLGAGSGALIGLASHNAGAGAAIGAGAGLLVGSSLGNNSALVSDRDMQRQYNNLYTQCMYAKGNQVPMPAGYVSSAQAVPPDYVPDGNVPPDYVPVDPDTNIPPDYHP